MLFFSHTVQKTGSGSPSKSFAYFGAGNVDVLLCNLASTGLCQQTTSYGLSTILNSPASRITGIAVHDSGNYGYFIANPYDNIHGTISYCAITAQGNIERCRVSNGGIDNWQPYSVAFNSRNASNIYITDPGNGNLYSCVQALNGQQINCSPLAKQDVFANAQGITTTVFTP